MQPVNDSASIRRRRLYTVLLAVGFLLAVTGQGLLVYRREAWLPGVLVCAAGGGLLGLLLLLARTRSLPWRAPVVGLALCLIALATYMAHWQRIRVAWLPWVLGVLLGAAGLWGGGRGARWHGRGRWREVVAVALLLVTALALRVIGLGDIPAPMSGDEGSMALEARQVLLGEWLNPFGTGWFSHANLFYYVQAASLRLGGWNLAALRLPTALLGTLSVGAVYLLGRGLFGRETAWVAALSMAGWSLLLHMGRMGLNNAADPLFAALVLALLQRGMVSGRRWHFVAAGLVLGLGLYFYFGTRLLVVLVPLMALLGGWRGLARRWRGLAVLAVVALLVAGPLLVHYALHPEDFVARMVTDGLFQSGELLQEQQASGSPVALLLAEHLWRAASAFVFTLDHGYFYTASTPMLQVVAGVFFVGGLLLALANWQQPRYGGLLLWIGLVVLVSGWLVRSPPGYHRYLLAAPAVSLLVGRGVVTAVRRMSGVLAWPRTVRRLAVLLLALTMAIEGAGYYFAVYVPSGQYADRNTEIADRAARLMAGLAPGYHSYFLGTPEMMLGGFNSVPFLAPEAQWADVDKFTMVWDDLPSEGGMLFVVMPERESDLPAIEAAWPDGESGEVTGDDEAVLFYTYRVDPAE